jgi:hypothetical protein
MELQMQPLDTYGLVVNFTILIMMPLIIWANLRQNRTGNPLNTYLWTEHPNLMRVSLVIIGLLVLYSAVALLGHFGFLAGGVVEVANIVIGIPFLFLALVEIVLAVRALRQFLRERKAGTSKI